MNTVPSRIVKELALAYAMKMESVQNYLAAFVNLAGDQANVINKLFKGSAVQELNHALLLAARIRAIGGKVPGSLTIARSQSSLQPLEDSADIVGLINGAVEAETMLIEQLKLIIRLCSGHDCETQDLASALLAIEKQHQREFRAYISEYEKASPQANRPAILNGSDLETSDQGDEDYDDETSVYTFAQD